MPRIYQNEKDPQIFINFLKIYESRNYKERINSNF